MTHVRESGAWTATVADGYPIAATHFPAHTSAHTTLIVASATAVPQWLYKRFALAAASRGFETTTFDYRGVGASKPATLRGFTADFIDWARLDLAGVIDQVRVPGRRTVLVGHSFGGQALGLLPAPQLVDAMYACGTGTGWHGFMTRSEAIRVRTVWQLLAPALALRHGYLPWSTVGNGEDVPLGVYKQWKNWCMRRRHFFDDPGFPEVHELFARVTAPIAAATSLDDPWVPPRSRDEFFAGYVNAAVTPIDIAPATRGMAPLGHMGYFRAGAEPLWDEIFDWFEGQDSRPSA